MKTKHLIILFVVSLLINAFLGGMMLSGCLDRDRMPFPQMGMKKGGMPPPMEGMIFKRLTEQSEKISPAGQKTVEGIVAKYQGQADKGGMFDKRHLFDDIQATMTAPKFDKQKIEKIHKELNAGETKFKESIGLMMIEIASKLSDKDRIQFFQSLFPPHPDMDKRGPHDRDNKRD